MSAARMDPRTPVLVGLGVATQREEDPREARDALGLMLAAADAAGRDCGVPGLLGAVGHVAVPAGRSAYGNAAGAIARHAGAPAARTIGSTVGVLQETLLADACEAIAVGAVDAALVAGGDAGYRILRSQITGLAVADTEAEGEPDTLLSPAEELRHPVELRAGLRQPVGLYAMIESALRARHGWTVRDHADRMARRYSRFTAIAAGNPHAWKRDVLSAEAIATPSPQNAVQAYPYNKLHCSSWNVDQAAALLFCSVAKAEAMAIPRERWVFPLASAEANAMVPVTARAVLASCPGARIAGEAALALAGKDIAAVDLFELYSCFPAAVAIYAEELGIPTASDLTVTGGMPFAGGPYNNYVLQATCRMAELLRRQPGKTGLVASVSGVITKQGMGLWSTVPNPDGFRRQDVSGRVAAAIARTPVVDDYAGPGRIAGFTVVHNRGQPPRAVVIADVGAGARTVAFSDDARLATRFQQAEHAGAAVMVDGAHFTLAEDV